MKATECKTFLLIHGFGVFTTFSFFFSQVSFKNSPAQHTIPHKREENTAWEDIRKLDEEQNWTERTQVVTKEEHNFYIETAKVRNEEFSSTEY